MHDHVDVKPGRNGTSVVTFTVPTDRLESVLSFIDMLVYMGCWLKTKDRSNRAISVARRL